MVRPERLELPAFWFVANGVNMLNALFGVAYGLETPFFPQLAAPNVAPKTELYRIRKLARDLFQSGRRRRTCALASVRRPNCTCGCPANGSIERAKSTSPDFTL